MNVEVMFFGQLTDITGSSRISVDDVQDTDTLKQKIIQRFPALSSSKFRIAVDNKIVDGNTLLSGGSRIAFMPPFSGG